MSKKINSENLDQKMKSLRNNENSFEKKLSKSSKNFDQNGIGMKKWQNLINLDKVSLNKKNQRMRKKRMSKKLRIEGSLKNLKSLNRNNERLRRKGKRNYKRN